MKMTETQIVCMESIEYVKSLGNIKYKKDKIYQLIVSNNIDLNNVIIKDDNGKDIFWLQGELTSEVFSKHFKDLRLLREEKLNAILK